MTDKDVETQVDEVADAYLRKLRRRSRLVTVALPTFACGLVFSLLGSVLGRAVQDGRWVDVACSATAAGLLALVYWIRVLN